MCEHILKTIVRMTPPETFHLIFFNFRKLIRPNFSSWTKHTGNYRT